MKISRRNGEIIQYTEAGKGSTTLVFVHGSFIDSTYFKAQVDYFSQQYHVIAIDLPGHGKSTMNRQHWTKEAFGDDLIQILKELEVKNAILIGHSMGGDVILEAAVKYPQPVLGLIGIDTFKNAGTPLPSEYAQQTEKIKEDLKKDFAATSERYARMVLLTPRTPRGIADRVVADYRKANPEMGYQIIVDGFVYDKREKELLQQIKCKLWLLNVDYMPTNEAALKQFLPAGYELINMRGSSHYPMIEHPEELNRLLEAIIINIITGKKSSSRATSGTGDGERMKVR